MNPVNLGKSERYKFEIFQVELKFLLVGVRIGRYFAYVKGHSLFTWKPGDQLHLYFPWHHIMQQNLKISFFKFLCVTKSSGQNAQNESSILAKQTKGSLFQGKLIVIFDLYDLS